MPYPVGPTFDEPCGFFHKRLVDVGKNHRAVIIPVREAVRLRRKQNGSRPRSGRNDSSAIRLKRIERGVRGRFAWLTLPKLDHNPLHRRLIPSKRLRDGIAPLSQEGDSIVMARTSPSAATRSGERYTQAVKPDDAIHVATALDANVEQFDTYDGQLIAVSGKVGNPPLTIGPPNVPETLF